MTAATTQQCSCRQCAHASSVRLSKSEAQEIVRCLWFNSLRAAGSIRRCDIFRANNKTAEELFRDV